MPSAELDRCTEECMGEWVGWVDMQKDEQVCAQVNGWVGSGELMMAGWRVGGWVD